MRHALWFIASLLALTTACAAQPSINSDAQLVSSPLGARLDSVLSKAATEGFSGVALVEKNGDIVLRKGYGMANRARGIPMSASTVVQIGSNTKDFTAVAILQLMELGKLSLDDSIGKYFRSVPPDKQAVTIRQLLNHRAGFPQHIGSDFDSVTREDEIRKALATPLKFPPGQGRGYSNTGYSLLGAIIEQVSGKSYDEYVRDEILVPAGLRETGFLLPRFDMRRLAHGYSADEDRGTMLSKPHASDGPNWNLRANGGMLSTVSDMHRFYTVLAGDKLLKPATRDLMFPPGDPVMLAGSDLVNYFLFNREPQAGVTIILASNNASLNAEQARNRLAGVLGLESGGNRRQVMTKGAEPGDTRQADESKATPAKTSFIPLPDTPAGRAVLGYLKAYNTGDLAVMRVYIRDSIVQAAGDTRTLDQRLEGYKRIHGDLGTLKLVGVESATAEQIVARVATGHGDEVTMTFDIEARPPYRIRGLRVEAQ